MNRQFQVYNSYPFFDNIIMIIEVFSNLNDWFFDSIILLSLNSAVIQKVTD